jgi:uncharacterized membrane protein YcaP (DUF421 family)
MDPILRVVVAYAFLLALFRLAGRRTIGDLSPFDFVLLLVISEFTQQAVVRDDPSLTAASVLCGSIVLLNVVLSLLKSRSRRLERWLEGVPVVLVEHGRPRHSAMRQARVDEEDILAAARSRQGLERMEQIRLAVLERTGGISVIPER